MKRKPKGVKNPPKDMGFKYPEGNKMIGKVLDEEGALLKTRRKDHGDYYFVCQLIEPTTMVDKDGNKYSPEFKEKHIRFGYYRRKPGSDTFRWGSQTTYHAPLSLTKKLLDKAKDKGML